MSVSSILFICLGNICRSPLAEGVMQKEAEKRGINEQLKIDSAGTANWHVGSPPDRRTIKSAAHNGVDLSTQTCRQLVPDDFHVFDLILGMDNSNLSNARAANRDNGPAHISLFMAWAGLGDVEIPDPYFDGPDGFEIAYEMIKQASIGALDRVAGS